MFTENLSDKELLDFVKNSIESTEPSCQFCSTNSLDLMANLLHDDHSRVHNIFLYNLTKRVVNCGAKRTIIGQSAKVISKAADYNPCGQESKLEKNGFTYILSDFNIERYGNFTSQSNPIIFTSWIKFMYEKFGEPYKQAYMTHIQEQAERLFDNTPEMI